MSIFDKLRTQKFLSFTLVLFTLSIGIVIGTLINSGVKAAKDGQVAPGATPLVIPNPVELSNAFSQIAKQAEPSRGQHFHHLLAEGSRAVDAPRREAPGPTPGRPGPGPGRQRRDG